MSADNWTLCPACNNRANHARSVFEKKVTDAYGRVSSDEYLRLIAILAKPYKLKETLREDYEIGITDGVFSVNYSASCKCGFSYKYKIKEEPAPNSERAEQQPTCKVQNATNKL